MIKLSLVTCVPVLPYINDKARSAVRIVGPYTLITLNRYATVVNGIIIISFYIEIALNVNLINLICT